MANFDRLAEQGKPIFLRHDQEAILCRLGLQSENGKILLRYCGGDYAVDRVSGDVTGPGALSAGPAETLTIFDMLCHTELPVVLSGEWRTTNTLPGCGQSSPDDVVLNSPRIRRFEANLPALRQACEALGGKPFPVGDVACVLPVFDWFPAVFQFWCGDDEFPSSARFLWDRSTLRYLHYETLYYIMGHILTRLDSLMQKS